MWGLTLLQDLAVVLLVAGAVAFLSQRLRQPAILGYLLAGVIIGPNTPPAALVQDEQAIRTLADLGVVFLLFALGLEFNLRRLRAIGLTAGVAAAIEIGVMLGLGYLAGRLAGFRLMDSLFLGAILALASSTVATALFREKGLVREPFAQVVFGILVAEDVLTILLLVLLAGIATAGSLRLGDLVEAVLRLAAFGATTLLVGLLVVPRLIGVVARDRRDELVLLVALGICFGLALLASKLGYSVALGAFVAGAIVAESPAAGRIERLVAPLRDLFGAVFFVAIGMLIEPAVLVEQAGLIAALLALLLLGKPLAVALGTFLMGLDLRTGLKAGLSVAQIGEFSFIIAQLGVSLGVAGRQLYPIAVAVSALAIFLSPHLIDAADRLVTGFERLAPARVVRGLALYTQRIRLLRAPPSRVPLWRLVRRSVRIIALNVVAITLLFAGSAVAVRWAEQRVGEGRWFPGDLAAAGWLVAALLALPFFVATWRKTEAVVMVLAEAALPRGGRPGEEERRVDAGRRLLMRTMLLVASGALAVWLLVLSLPLLPPWPVFLALLVLEGLLLWALWGAMVRLYARVQARLEEILREAPPQTAEARAALVDLLQRKHPWDARVAEVVLPEHAAAAGRTLGELDVRGRTGAAVVGLHRGGLHLINPPASVPLFPGDAVVLVGGERELAAARALLCAERPAGGRPGELERVEIATVEVGADSPLAGMRVDRTPLRARYGVALVGLQQGERRMPSPPPDAVIRPGDLVVVLGLPEAVAQARAWIEGKETDDAAAGGPGDAEAAP
ncbi:MAG TPA: cation:proton antiporter, partial [Thermodesulfobacteriota bacterium]|nr:cation:proton antiporter [Thermodesulfobacteriota bacterium]